jgi:hypothetical protein
MLLRYGFHLKVPKRSHIRNDSVVFIFDYHLPPASELPRNANGTNYPNIWNKLSYKEK